MSQKKRILIVEDEEELSKLTAMRLEANGYEVERVNNGEDGIFQIRHTHPDLVILDLVLPKLDGVEVLREVRADPLLKRIPIIVLTAYGIRDILEDCKKYGANEVMAKPYNAVKLVRRIGELLKSEEETAE